MVAWTLESTDRLQRAHRRCAAFTRAHLAGTEIANLDVHVTVYQNVFGLKISMDHLFRVHVV